MTGSPGRSWPSTSVSRPCPPGTRRADEMSGEMSQTRGTSHHDTLVRAIRHDRLFPGRQSSTSRLAAASSDCPPTSAASLGAAAPIAYPRLRGRHGADRDLHRRGWPACVGHRRPSAYVGRRARTLCRLHCRILVWMLGSFATAAGLDGDRRGLAKRWPAPGGRAGPNRGARRSCFAFWTAVNLRGVSNGCASGLDRHVASCCRSSSWRWVGCFSCGRSICDRGHAAGARSGARIVSAAAVSRSPAWSPRSCRAARSGTPRARCRGRSALDDRRHRALRHPASGRPGHSWRRPGARDRRARWRRRPGCRLANGRAARVGRRHGVDLGHLGGMTPRFRDGLRVGAGRIPAAPARVDRRGPPRAHGRHRHAVGPRLRAGHHGHIRRARRTGNVSRWRCISAAPWPPWSSAGRVVVPVLASLVILWRLTGLNRGEWLAFGVW